MYNRHLKIRELFGSHRESTEPDADVCTHEASARTQLINADTMSNRSKRTLVAEAEPTFTEHCIAKWARGTQSGAKWDKETFEDFPVCVHWFRQIIAVIVGLALGFMGVTGAPGIVGGFGFVTGVTYFYYAGFVEADEMSYGDNGLKMEGLLPSLALFLLTWTVSFTAFGHTLTPDA